MKGILKPGLGVVCNLILSHNFLEKAIQKSPLGSRGGFIHMLLKKPVFRLMKCLHQCPGADDQPKPKRPLGPAGPVPAFGLSIFPFLRLRLRNASLRLAPES
jgi:hypothetical protein